jgi:hypothetical protein
VGNVALDVVEVLIVVVDDMVLVEVVLDRAGHPADPPGIYV